MNNVKVVYNLLHVHLYIKMLSLFPSLPKICRSDLYVSYKIMQKRALHHKELHE